jgi:hypothetical protein
MSAVGGNVSLELAGTGAVTVPAGHERCYYLDLPSGSVHDVVFAARESAKNEGIAPVLQIAEYGPSGPYWYDIFAVACNDGPGGRCDRRAADEWGASVRRQSKRGRLDPCGSTVVSRLSWGASGGMAERDGGLYRDLAVRFTMDVKKFATERPPRSKECAPP